MIYEWAGRKFLATLSSAITFSIFMSAFGVLQSEKYQLGMNFISMFFVYLLYAGVIILIYGNIVSFLIEYFFTKWKYNNVYIYILLHTAFGLVFTLVGGSAALLYALFDRWYEFRINKEQPKKSLVLGPILLVFLTWLGFHIFSPPLPPFTMKDAVEYAVSGEGTPIDLYPKKVGKWEGMVDSFQVVRETKATKKGPSTYIVTFKETWKNEFTSGTWYTSYKVERGSMSIIKEGGYMPPYLK